MRVYVFCFFASASAFFSSCQVFSSQALASFISRFSDASSEDVNIPEIGDVGLLSGGESGWLDAKFLSDDVAIAGLDFLCRVAVDAS